MNRQPLPTVRVDFRDRPDGHEGCVYLGMGALSDLIDAGVVPVYGLPVVVRGWGVEADAYLAVDQSGIWTANFDPNQLREVTRG